MVLPETIIKCADNSGAKLLKVIHVVGFPPRVPALAGDEILVVVQKAIPGKKAKQGEQYRAVLIQSSTTPKRPYGKILHGRNIAVLLRRNDNLPLGNRISKRYAVFREVREKGWFRVAQLAHRIILQCRKKKK